MPCSSGACSSACSRVAAGEVASVTEVASSGAAGRTPEEGRNIAGGGVADSAAGCDARQEAVKTEHNGHHHHHAHSHDHVGGAHEEHTGHHHHHAPFHEHEHGPSEAEHTHGKGCGHLAVVHKVPGEVHVGFLEEHGKVECFTVDASVDMNALCFDGAIHCQCPERVGVHLHAHRLTAACAKKRDTPCDFIDDVTIAVCKCPPLIPCPVSLWEPFVGNALALSPRKSAASPRTQGTLGKGGAGVGRMRGHIQTACCEVDLVEDEADTLLLRDQLGGLGGGHSCARKDIKLQRRGGADSNLWWALAGDDMGHSVRQALGLDAGARVRTPSAEISDVMVVVDPPVAASSASVTTLLVEGICCASEIPIVKKCLKPLAGVDTVQVNVIGRTVTVSHAAELSSPQALADALNKARLQASVLSSLCDSGEVDEDGAKKALEALAARAESKRYPKWNVVVGAVFWALSLVHYGAASYPEDSDTHTVFAAFKYCGIVAVLLAIVPILRRSFASLKRGVLDINTLMTIAVAGACAMQDFSEAAAVVVLFALSDWLESRATSGAREAIGAISALRPEEATLSDGKTVPVTKVAVGTIVLVHPGERVPIDGTVEAGETSIDESNLTGESRPVSKRVGDAVHAGTINAGGGALRVRTSALSSNSAVARLVRLVEAAQLQSSPTEERVALFAKWYTPTVVLVSLLFATIPWAYGAEEGREWLKTSLVMLVVACPCALVISTPITYVCGLAHAARCGILLKGGKHLETLGHLQILAIDKTGTLTEGAFRINELRAFSESLSEAELFQLLLTAQQQSAHPMAVAVCASAQKRGIVAIPGGASCEVVKGEGIRATIKGRVVEVGNRRMLNRILPAAPVPEADAAREWEANGATVSWVFVDGVAAAIFSAVDKPRPEAAEAVAMLTKLGVRTLMLTGDNQGSALAVQRIVGITEVWAGLLPEDKMEHLKRLRAEPLQGGGFCAPKHACVGMVGDGVNDTPALALASVGIAMGVAGSAVAMETSDVALMDSDLRKLAKAVELGRQVLRVITQNCIFAIVVKVAVFALALGGYPFLWLAIVSDVGAMIIVTLNGVSVLGKAPRRRRHPSSSQKLMNMVGAASPMMLRPRGDDGDEVEAQGLLDGGDDEGCGHAHAHSHGHGHGHGHAHANTAGKGGGCCAGKVQQHGQGHGHGHGHKAETGGGGCCAGKVEKACCAKPKATECCAPKRAPQAGGCCSAVPKSEAKGCCARKEEKGDDDAGCGGGHGHGHGHGHAHANKAETGGGCCAKKSAELAPCCASKVEKACCASKTCGAAEQAPKVPTACCAPPAPHAAPKACCASGKCASTPPVVKACCGAKAFPAPQEPPREEHGHAHEAGREERVLSPQKLEPDGAGQVHGHGHAHADVHADTGHDHAGHAQAHAEAGHAHGHAHADAGHGHAHAAAGHAHAHAEHDHADGGHDHAEAGHAHADAREEQHGHSHGHSHGH